MTPNDYSVKACTNLEMFYNFYYFALYFDLQAVLSRYHYFNFDTDTDAGPKIFSIPIPIPRFGKKNFDTNTNTS
ncbi:MAG: hypothetical protein GY820_27630, partial [Gammaproteobacteria bacterium]|nr:hypothetical protein [Gammaproteobacteria bacterium]